MSLFDDLAEDIRDTAFTADDFGIPITYTPVGGEAFDCTAIIGAVQVDELERHIVRDMRECRILHAALSENSVLAPTFFRERQVGDTITMPDQNGVDQEWKVIDGSLSINDLMWVLILEKNVRVIP